MIRWPSDWLCHACGNYNFSRNVQCFYCIRLTLRGIKRGPALEEDSVIIKRVKHDDCVVVRELHPVIDLTPIQVEDAVVAEVSLKSAIQTKTTACQTCLALILGMLIMKLLTDFSDTFIEKSLIFKLLQGALQETMRAKHREKDKCCS